MQSSGGKCEYRSNSRWWNNPSANPPGLAPRQHYRNTSISKPSCAHFCASTISSVRDHHRQRVARRKSLQAQKRERYELRVLPYNQRPPQTAGEQNRRSVQSKQAWLFIYGSHMNPIAACVSLNGKNTSNPLDLHRFVQKESEYIDRIVELSSQISI